MRGSKAWRALTALLRQPRLAGAVLHDNRYWKRSFARAYGHTDPLPVTPLSTIVPPEASLDTYCFLGGSSMITDLLLLKHLAQRDEIQSYFEIGTWRGESLLAVAGQVRHAYSLDLGVDTMDRFGYPQTAQSEIGRLVARLENITQLKGDSRHFDFSGLSVKMDLIFIDGNHTYDFVVNDTMKVIQHLCHDRTVLVWHDYAYDPEQIRWEVYQGIMDGLPSAMHRGLYHAQNTKCAIQHAHQPLPAEAASFPEVLKEVWSVQIKRRTY